MNETFSIFKTYSLVSSPDDPAHFHIAFDATQHNVPLLCSDLVDLTEFLRNEDLSFLSETIPYFHNPSFENLTLSEAEELADRFLDPASCLDYVDGNQILLMLTSRKPQGLTDMLKTLNTLLDFWRAGYYVYMWD